MKLIIGLGNPGSKYRNTYHNLGFMVVDAFAKNNKKIKFKKECESKYIKGEINNEQFVIAKPQTFMNNSGNAVRQLINKFNIAPEDILVIFDDADIPLGHMRARMGGSAGSHNGMRNIISLIGFENFKRLRIGFQDENIKKRNTSLLEKVLSRIEYENQPIIDKCINEAAKIVEDFISGETFERIMAEVNTFDGTK